MNWIDIKEKLPQDGDRVIVYTPNNIANTKNGSVLVSCYRHRDFYFDGYGNILGSVDLVGEVTHWMPLPKVQDLLGANKIDGGSENGK